MIIGSGVTTLPGWVSIVAISISAFALALLALFWLVPAFRERVHEHADDAGFWTNVFAAGTPVSGLVFALVSVQSFTFAGDRQPWTVGLSTLPAVLGIAAIGAFAMACFFQSVTSTKAGAWKERELELKKKLEKLANEKLDEAVQDANRRLKKAANEKQKWNQLAVKATNDAGRHVDMLERLKGVHELVGAMHHAYRSRLSRLGEHLRTAADLAKGERSKRLRWLKDFAPGLCLSEMMVAVHTATMSRLKELSVREVSGIHGKSGDAGRRPVRIALFVEDSNSGYFKLVSAWDGSDWGCMDVSDAQCQALLKRAANVQASENVFDFVSHGSTPDEVVIDHTESVEARTKELSGGGTIVVPFKSVTNPEPVQSMAVFRARDFSRMVETNVVVSIDSGHANLFREDRDLVWLRLLAELFGGRFCVEVRLKQEAESLQNA